MSLSLTTLYSKTTTTSHIFCVHQLTAISCDPPKTNRGGPIVYTSTGPLLFRSLCWRCGCCRRFCGCFCCTLCGGCGMSRDSQWKERNPTDETSSSSLQSARTTCKGKCSHVDVLLVAALPIGVLVPLFRKRSCCCCCCCCGILASSANITR